MSKDNFIPDRRDIIWLDFEPTIGKEIGKYRPALVLSSKVYNKTTGLLICCLISTSIRNSKTEILISIFDKPSVITASLIYTFAFKERKAKWIAQLDLATYQEVLECILPLIGSEEL